MKHRKVVWQGPVRAPEVRKLPYSTVAAIRRQYMEIMGLTESPESPCRVIRTGRPCEPGEPRGVTVRECARSGCTECQEVMVPWRAENYAIKVGKHLKWVCDGCGGLFREEELAVIGNDGFFCDDCDKGPSPYWLCKGCGKRTEVEDEAELDSVFVRNGDFWCDTCIGWRSWG